MHFKVWSNILFWTNDNFDLLPLNLFLHLHVLHLFSVQLILVLSRVETTDHTMHFIYVVIWHILSWKNTSGKISTGFEFFVRVLQTSFWTYFIITWFSRLGFQSIFHHHEVIFLVFGAFVFMMKLSSTFTLFHFHEIWIIVPSDLAVWRIWHEWTFGVAVIGVFVVFRRSENTDVCNSFFLILL